MARLVPKLNLSEIRNGSERKVATVLVEQLPENNVVIHSFNWVRRESCTIVEGECDFVVIDPDRGVLFVEVKGGIVKYLPDEGVWVRVRSGDGDSMPIKDPFAQVSRNMHAIVEFAASNLKLERFPHTYGCAVMFPDGIFHGPLPAGVQREQIFDANTLKQMSKGIRRVIRLFSRKSAVSMSATQLRQLQHALLPKFEIVPVLYRTIEDQELMLHRTTEDQKNLLSSLSEHSIAAIRGGAGTGKTLLAIAKAQQLAANGIRTLLVCYNRALKDWLLETVSDEFADLLSISTFHSLADDFCRLAGIEFIDSDSASDQSFWNDVAPSRLAEACDRLPDEHKFDAVIVDEGQDFQLLWWTSIEYVFRDPDHKSCYYIFYDPWQKFGKSNTVDLPDGFGNPFVLNTNCRNTTQIAEHCAAIINEPVTTKADMPSGVSPQIHHESGWQSAFKKAQRIVGELCRADGHGLKFSQVVILTPGYAKKHWPDKARVTQIADAINQWRNDESILIASLHQFKGLEADAVVLLTASLSKISDDHNTDDYVGCSRAKHILHVVHVNEDQ
ncbi:MAG: NERD domain-containing protein [Acidiferrobacterales bacterium]|nr:NERD domain-containing protein [Acidiferrobacterales bacterium]